MLQWKENLAPDCALFLEGARGVGKTTLAEKLGKEAYQSYLVIRFDQVSPEVKTLFEESPLDLDRLFNALQVIFKTRLYPRQSLIILDEIQCFPPARQALKTLLEDGRYDYLETGSLASITKKSKDILIPSEEHILEVLPMDFEEFMWAQGDDLTVPAIRDHYEKLKPVKALHKGFMKSFREYMLVGGMPQSVRAFVETKDYGNVDRVKQKLLTRYIEVMSTKRKKGADPVSRFFDHIPSELAKKDKRYVLSHLGKSVRLREYQRAIDQLTNAGLVQLSHSVKDPTETVAFTVNPSNFKAYLMDTGLLISLAVKGRPYLENSLYEAILCDRLHVNEGMILENIVAQSLSAKGHRPHFYIERDPKTRKTKMEIDFLIRDGEKGVGLVIKGSNSSRIKSLQRLKEKFGKRIGDGIVFHHGEVKREGNIVYLPYYMVTVI